MRYLSFMLSACLLVMALTYRNLVAQSQPATEDVPLLCAANDGVRVGTVTVVAPGAGPLTSPQSVCPNHRDAILAFGFVPSSVEHARALRCSDVDKTTASTIAKGFDWTPPSSAPGTPPTRMSLSAKAKEIYHGLLTGDSRGIVSYPVVVGGLSDVDLVPLQGSADVLSLYGAAMAAVQTQEIAGLGIKAQVQAAQTVEAVAAVVDER